MLAARLFPDRDPIGQRIWLGDRPHEVVGVVAQYSNTVFQNRDWDPKIFVPLAEGPVTQMEFLVRTSSDPAAVLRALRAEIRRAAPGNVVAAAFTLDEIVSVGGQEILVGTAPLVPLIATGILLTAAGIYGVLAFAMTRRSKELALRVAIGATTRDVLALITAQGLKLIAIGTVCGTGATFALSRAVGAIGGAGSFLDPNWITFAVPVAVIVGVGAIAMVVPSRRALKIDPAVLLRTT